MKVVFWSNTLQEAGTTSNMIAIALSIAIRTPYRILLMESQRGTHCLDDILIPCKNVCEIKEDYQYFQNSGVDYLLQMGSWGRMDEEVFRQSTESLIEGQAYYMPGTKKRGMELYEQQMKNQIESILTMAEKVNDITFIDCGGKSNALTVRMMELSDVIVVNVPQNYEFLNQFFQTHQKFSDKLIFLLGNYQKKGICSMETVQRIYRIPEQILGRVCYQPDFHFAYQKGKIVKYMQQIMTQKTGSRQEDFVKSINEAANLILGKAGIYV